MKSWSCEEENIVWDVKFFFRLKKKKKKKKKTIHGT